VENAEDRKKKADSVYLQALKAAQANDFTRAYNLCQETLQINPRHLQAQKMAERLGSRHIP
jgi:predicted metal-dependent hydrolase